jgi:hypothetical protein
VGVRRLAASGNPAQHDDLAPFIESRRRCAGWRVPRAPRGRALTLMSSIPSIT